MSKKLWEASKKEKNYSNLFKYEKFLSKKFKYKPSKNFNKLFKWSIQNKSKFWSSIWDFCDKYFSNLNRFEEFFSFWVASHNFLLIK